MTVEGELLDGGREQLQNMMEIWYRDPVECIKFLMGNPAFKEFMAYAPEQVYCNKGNEHIYDKTWIAGWWWKTQVRKPC